MNQRLREYLQSVEISHRFAKDFKHGIETSLGEWDMFEPTRFIYAFFAFNMLYSIDWESTVDNGRLIYQNNRDNKAYNQMDSLIQFIHSSNPEAFTDALITLDEEKVLFNITSSLDRDYNSSKPSDGNKKMSKADAFLEAAKKFTQGETMDTSDHIDLIEMTYAVRNNLFHGEKKAGRMKEKGHRNRLYHYGNVLLATNESFFNVMEIEFGYRRMEEHEVGDNI